MAAFTSSRRFSMREKASGVSSSSSSLMYPVRSIRNLRSSAVFAAAPGARKAVSTASPAPSPPSVSSSVERRAPSPITSASAASPAAKSKLKLPGLKSVPSSARIGSSCVGADAFVRPAERSSAALSPDPTPAVSSTRSTKLPASIARPSSISARKLLSAANARAGSNCLLIASPTAPHIDNPVSRASRSIISIVVLPIPRTGVLITRSSETESSGLSTTFKYEIKSLISARS